MKIVIEVNPSPPGFYPGSLAANRAYGPSGPYGRSATVSSGNGTYAGGFGTYARSSGASLSDVPTNGGPGVYYAATPGSVHIAPLVGHSTTALSGFES